MRVDPDASMASLKEREKELPEASMNGLPPLSVGAELSREFVSEDVLTEVMKESI